MTMFACLQIGQKTFCVRQHLSTIMLPESPLLKESLPMSKTMARGAADTANDDGETADVGGVAGKRLRSFLERIERLEEEKTGLAEDMKEIYAEAKGVGFDVKTMRRILKLRKMEPEKRREQDELLQLYMSAIGMAA
jgi:uncharacterized protein (UPF0335 family)